MLYNTFYTLCFMLYIMKVNVCNITHSNLSSVHISKHKAVCNINCISCNTSKPFRCPMSVNTIVQIPFLMWCNSVATCPVASVAPISLTGRVRSSGKQGFFFLQILCLPVNVLIMSFCTLCWVCSGTQLQSSCRNVRSWLWPSLPRHYEPKPEVADRPE